MFLNEEQRQRRGERRQDEGDRGETTKKVLPETRVDLHRRLASET
jgi:hypothetical protein